MRPLEPARRSRSRLAVSLMVATAMLGVSACGAQGSSAPTVLTDKGTPYSDLLIPELTATVSDGSVGSWSISRSPFRSRAEFWVR